MKIKMQSKGTGEKIRSEKNNDDDGFASRRREVVERHNSINIQPINKIKVSIKPTKYGEHEYNNPQNCWCVLQKFDFGQMAPFVVTCLVDALLIYIDNT